MALTPAQIDAFINNGAVVEYLTLGDRLPIRARYERNGSEGTWISQITGRTKGSEQIGVARARSYVSASDVRMVRGG